MTELIFALVLWLILGALAVVALWVGTVASSGVLGVIASTGGYIGRLEIKPWVPVVTFIVGIILTILTLITVVYNVIATIVSMVTYGG